MFRLFSAVVLLLASLALAQGPTHLYSPAGKRDPFRPPDVKTPPLPACITGSCRFALDELKLVATVTGTADRTAMVLAPDGTGYLLRPGSKLARERAVVKRISAAQIELEVGQTRVHLRIPAEAGAEPEDLSRRD